MKPDVDPKLNRYRVGQGPYASTEKDGHNGAFFVPGPRKATLKIICGEGLGWEHVSVSVHKKQRCPTWEEMCFVKDLFWQPEEMVVQYHPPKSAYVNVHNYVLHLWKPKNAVLPAPPLQMV